MSAICGLLSSKITADQAQVDENHRNSSKGPERPHPLRDEAVAEACACALPLRPARGRSVRPPRRALREQLGRPFLQRCTTGFDHIRAWLAVWLAESTVDLLGGQGCAMVIDECWLSRQKRSQRDQGRVTKPQEILAPRGTESQWRPPLLRAERRAETIERVARSLCCRGCEIWSDEWSGHHWLDAPDCTYNAVNHMKKSRRGGKAPTPARTTSAGSGDIFANVVYARAKKWLIAGLVLREFT